jgi:hypothetical protein
MTGQPEVSIRNIVTSGLLTIRSGHLISLLTTRFWTGTRFSAHPTEWAFGHQRCPLLFGADPQRVGIQRQVSVDGTGCPTNETFGLPAALLNTTEGRQRASPECWRLLSLARQIRGSNNASILSRGRLRKRPPRSFEDDPRVPASRRVEQVEEER